MLILRSRSTHMMKLKKFYGLVVCFALLPAVAYAGPAVFSIDTGGDRLAQGVVARITGTEFGVKDESSPVLVDYVSYAYEYGKLNSAYSEFVDGEVIEPASVNPNSLWAAVSSDLPVRFDTKSKPRHPFDKARYHLFGENVWLGRPVVYGGPGGWDTPINNSQLYISWWVKVDYNSLYYWRFTPSEMSGDFQEREVVRSNGEVIGEYIGKDKEGLLNFVFPGHPNANKLKGVQLVGVESGAKTVFPDEFRAGSGVGYETPGTKTLRIWDDPDSRGIRTSLSHTDYFLVAYSDRNYSSNRVYQSRDMIPDVWHHFEVELDVGKGTLKSWFNGQLGGIAKFDPRTAYQDAYSPTIALIGNNAKQDQLQNMYISEIYMDKSVQRVVIGNAPNYDDLTHYELQRPVRWGRNEIEFSVNLGAFDSSSGLYLYVFDENGVPNKNGFSLCASVDCPSPPEPIQLQVN